MLSQSEVAYNEKQEPAHPKPRLIIQKIDVGPTSAGELFVLLGFVFSIDIKLVPSPWKHLSLCSWNAVIDRCLCPQILFLDSHFLIIGPQNKHYPFPRM